MHSTPNSYTAMILGKRNRKKFRTVFPLQVFYRWITDGDPMYYHIALGNE